MDEGRGFCIKKPYNLTNLTGYKYPPVGENILSNKMNLVILGLYDKLSNFPCRLLSVE